MRRATRAAASLLGAAAGLAGIEHGTFEILQGDVRPSGLVIASMGAPCAPETAWHLCEPAMTVIPSFLVSGILSIVFGLAVLVWAAAFVQRPSGGALLIGLSAALLLVGGGFFPPFIGIVAGAAATRINAPIIRQPGSVLRFFARWWPWPLAILLAWLVGQWIVGYFFNEFLRNTGALTPVLILGLLALSIYAAFARDAAASSDANAMPWSAS